MLPDAVALLPGEKEAECWKHGWSPVIRKATPREIVEMYVQTTITEIPDQPPY